MADLVASGRIVDLILALVVLEAIGLVVWRRLTGRGIEPVGLVANLAAGACLLLALRAALTGSGWETIAAWLAASFVAHGVDLTRRWG